MDDERKSTHRENLIDERSLWDVLPKPVKKRRRVKQTVELEERLAGQARDDREQARSLPPGKEREDLLRHARRIDEATRMTKWLTAPSSNRKA